MELFAYAMTMEKDGETYYRELSNKIDHEGLKRILTMLADEEVKHYQIIERMSRKFENIEIGESKVLDHAKNIFIQMKDNKEDNSVVGKEIDLYQKAKEIEKKSRLFYLEKAEESEEKQHKQVFLKLADEEQRHEFLIDKLIEFISRPDSWFEDSEWYQLNDY